MFNFRKLDTPVCHDCQAPVDDAEHVVFIYDRWFRRRREPEVRINADFSPEMAVNKMLKSKSNWDGTARYIE